MYSSLTTGPAYFDAARQYPGLVTLKQPMRLTVHKAIEVLDVTPEYVDEHQVPTSSHNNGFFLGGRCL